MNDEEIYTYLVSAGLEPHQAAGVLGNLHQESGLNPTAVNPKSGAFGLPQWLGPRKRALHEFAASSGRDASDPRTQLDFMIAELNGPESRARRSLLAARTPEEAALAFSHGYERAGVNERRDDRRTSRARHFLDRMMEKYGMPALNAAIPAAQADQAPPPPAGFDFDEPPAQAASQAQDIPPPPTGFDFDEPPAQRAGTEPAGAPTASIPFVSKTDNSQGIGNPLAGIRRGLEKQVTGAQQVGSDVARWVSGESGQPYSDYRQAVNHRGERLEAESRNAPIGEQAGEHALSLVELAAIPTPTRGGPLARVAANSLTGAGFAALDPAATSAERAESVVHGALLGGAAPEVMGGITRGLGAATGYTRGIIQPRVGAARELTKQLEAKFGRGSLPPEGPPPLGRFAGDGMGPPRPHYDLVPGAQPTVGMVTDDPRLLELEMNARNRASSDFAARDIQNKRAVHEALNKRALSDREATALQDALDAKTGSLREAAFDAARRNPDMLESPAGPLEIYVDRLKTQPGMRSDPNVQSLASLSDRTLNPRAGEPIADPADLYSLRKLLDQKLESKMDFDSLSSAAKGARRETVGIKQAIDEGLNKASGDRWSNYLTAHREGMKPIAEGRAFQDIVDDFATAGHLPGTDIPNITPAKLRRASENLTYTNLGKAGWVDKLSPEGRLALEDAKAVLNGIEQAQKGSQATSGSSTATYLSSLAKSGLIPGSSRFAAAINLLDALGRSRGARELDKALLDPARFEKVLEEARRLDRNTPPGALSEIVRRTSGRLPLVINNARR